jgi:hypothetical protein
MANIQQPENGNTRPAFDINTALVPRLIVSDQGTGNATEDVAGDMRIIAAPKHPGRDPVSTNIIEQLVSVLRGNGGLAPRMAGITNRLRESAVLLQASLDQHQVMDYNTAHTLGRINDELRP